MIQTRVLIGGVVSIFIMAGVAYAVVSPRINSSEGAEATSSSTPTGGEDIKTIPISADSYDDSDGRERENEDEREDGEDDNRASDIESTIVDTPTTQTSAPTVTETPALVKSGYTLAEVAQHATKDSCWTIVNGGVYDITSYIPRHPGGERNIMKICGKDGTALFEDQHGGESQPESKLASLYIGPLVK